ncbi:hypothetical protein MNB_SV-14-1295 [hydrothermal vent metagenome]|uniref:Uncharacterized protein n=1 Tax=hydrothermal vent metagenome TaxID=652676 RepID=A0A1W1CQQ3_9ZZZZ
MSDQYDPYRNTVRQALQDKAIEKRRKDFIKKENEAKAKKFLQKKIYLSDFINLPEGLASGIFVGLFIAIPYFIGIIFVFIVIAKANFHIYETIGNSFAFSWVIGYEFLAGILLLMILKSSMQFR